jgi:peptidoglycan/xylan/chitin deacetylase (PgdA/CDA1 family)
VSKTSAQQGVNRPRTESLPGVPILLYHSVSETATPAYRPFAIDPETFALQMDVLIASGRTALTVGQYVSLLRSGAELPERPVVLTFDDGFRDFREFALPVLAVRELRATLYLVSVYIEEKARWLEGLGEGDRELLGWKELCECQAYGIELGSHGHSHSELDTLPLVEAQEEIVLSKHILEESLGTEIGTFAYPHGYHDRRLRAAVIAAGYTSACAVKNAVSPFGDDPFALARITVTSDLSLDRFCDLLDGRGVPRAWQRERLATRAWRIYRRTRARRHHRLEPAAGQP